MLLPTARRPSLQPAAESHPRAVLATYLPRGGHAQHVQSQAVGDERPRRKVQGEHVLLPDRGPGVRPQADELPRPLPHVQAPQALVPRAAAAPRRLRRAAPQRALRCAHGPHARAPLPAGRRPYLLHGRPDQAGGAPPRTPAHARTHARSRTRTPTRSRAHTPARPHARTPARTHARTPARAPRTGASCWCSVCARRWPTCST